MRWQAGGDHAGAVRRAERRCRRHGIDLNCTAARPQPDPVAESIAYRTGQVTSGAELATMNTMPRCRSGSQTYLGDPISLSCASVGHEC
jgi:hypothetical protein